MGYTHYWGYDPINPQYIAAESMLFEDARKIIKAAKRRGIYTTSPWRRNNAIVSDAGIALNGWPPYGSTEDPCKFYEESFVLGPLDYYTTLGVPHETDSDSLKRAKQEYRITGKIFRSCMTGRKPYDLVVTAILLRASELMGDVFQVSSDGCWDDPNGWLPAREFYARVFHTDPPMPTLMALHVRLNHDSTLT